jgi:hypothetical protein
MWLLITILDRAELGNKESKVGRAAEIRVLPGRSAQKPLGKHSGNNA